MKYSKNELINHIKKIRKEIGHSDSEINIKKILFNEDINELKIIALDRPDKSAIIGKGGWVVGKLKESLKLNKIHVESYSDYILKKYQIELSLKAVKDFISKYPKNENFLINLEKLLEEMNKDIYNFNLNSYLENLSFTKKNRNSYLENTDSKNENKHKAIVALSGGVDSSFSLILAKKLGFNPIAITIDPGTIILPRQFKSNIDKLCKKLDIEHIYLNIDYNDIIENSLNGNFHPCGRCSQKIKEVLFDYTVESNIDIVIFGDMLSTGSQCITKHDIMLNKTKNNSSSQNNSTYPTEKKLSKDNDSANINEKNIPKQNNSMNINEENKNNNSMDDKYNQEKNLKAIYRLNLPACLSIAKEEIKTIVSNYGLEKIQGFGCPLLYEVHKKYPHMKKFSIQRILRETRSNSLESGEALELIWSFYKL